VTFEVVTKCLFSCDLGEDKDELQKSIYEVLGTTAKRIATIIPPILPTPRNLRFKKAKADLYEKAGKIVERRLTDTIPKFDLLSLLTQESSDERFDRRTFWGRGLTL